MNNEEHFLYESNHVYSHLFKYLFLYISLISSSTAILGYFWPNIVTINNSDISVSGVGILLILSLLSLIVFFSIKNKFAHIKVNNRTISVSNPKINRQYNWEEVKSINLIPFIFPPLYKIRINDNYFIFTTDNKYIFISLGVIKDVSEMGQFMSKKAKN
ncbi:hypothetical protein [Cyclobacterium amurskyense]|uniref:hypothetical protein n=1 Tax=Cyclobacterium amurskyense TaxID=320787 RepID=UPI0030D8D1E6|tara:strand:+ start:3191 stop:3667 length:477 start_codon:yes stop_codon:yes gene_type:complete